MALFDLFTCPIQGFSISRTSNTQNGSSSKPQVATPRKPQISGK